MTLHEAIEQVLMKYKKPLSAKQIADEINKGNLYQRKDGNPVPSSQIHARAARYPSLFAKNNQGFIRLITKEDEIDTAIKFEKMFHASDTHQESELTLHEAIEKVLYENKRAMTAKEIAHEINSRKLYNRRDNLPIPTNQIFARIKNYPNFFKTDKRNGITYISKSQDYNSYDRFFYIQKLLSKKVNIGIEKQIQLVFAWFLFLKLLDDKNLMDNYLPSKKEKFYASIPNFLIFLNSLNRNSKFEGKLKPLIDYFAKTGYHFIVQELLTELNEIYDNLKKNGQIKNEISIIDLTNKLFSSNERGENYLTPKSLTELIAKLSLLFSFNKIYNPGAGLCTLPIKIKQEGSNNFIFYGEEINSNNYLLGLMNLIINDIDPAHFENKDSLEFNEITKIDDCLIVSNPPFVGKNYDLTSKFPFETRDLNNAFIQKIVFSLGKNSIAFVIVPESFLFRSDNAIKSMRNYLIEENILDTVISLPIGVFAPITGIKTSLLILNTAKETQEVTFLDAEENSLSEKGSHGSVHLNADEIVNTLIRSSQENTTSVTKQIIGTNESNLTVQFQNFRSVSKDLLTDSTFIMLGNILEKVDFFSSYKTENIKYLSIKNLSTSYDDFILDTQNLEFAKDRSFNVVNEDAILYGSIKGSNKPTFYKSTNEPIAVSPGIYSLRVKKDSKQIVNIDYLLLELKSQYVIDQVNAYSTGSTSLQRISLTDLFNVKIKLPSIEEQIRIVNSRKETIQASKTTKIDYTHEEVISKKETENTILTAVVHEINGIAGGMKSDLKNIKELLLANNFDFEQKINALPNSRTLKNVFSDFEKNRSDIENIMLNIENIVNAETNPTDFEEVEIKKFFIDEVSKNNQVLSGFNIFYGIEDNYDSDEDIKLTIDKIQFSLLLRNFLLNTIKHGYTDSEEFKCILFNFKIEEDFIYIDMINNGKPFPRDFTVGDFIRIGRRVDNRKGSGFGGFLMNLIIKNHNGKLELIDSTLPNQIPVMNSSLDHILVVNASVHFRVKLPLNQN